MKIQVSEQFRESRAVIKVIGVGGAGGNAVNRMAEAGTHGVELIAANTDAQVLRDSLAEIKVQVGETSTKGLGVGGDPSRGRAAMLESEEDIREIVHGADMVFITAGMGGGTGTGGAPIVARLAKEAKALTIGVVTRPFEFEKINKANLAEAGIQEMRQNVDTLLVIPNQRLLGIADAQTTVDEAFRLADDVLRKSIQSISDVITRPGHINTDLNDIRAIMENAGDALIGMGEESGHGRALRAVKAAIESPLLENVVMDGAKGLIVNITTSKTGDGALKMPEMEEAMAVITAAASPDVKLKIGNAYDNSLGDAIRITVIATGFPTRRRGAPRANLGGPAARRPIDLPSDAPAGRIAAGPEDWTKPAYMRLKVRRLK